MNRSAGVWIILGISIATCWVAAAHLFPTANLGQSTLAVTTAPAALFGRTRPLGAVTFVLLNGFLYGLAGLAVHGLLRWRTR